MANPTGKNQYSGKGRGKSLHSTITSGLNDKSRSAGSGNGKGRTGVNIMLPQGFGSRPYRDDLAGMIKEIRSKPGFRSDPKIQNVLKGYRNHK